MRRIAHSSPLPQAISTQTLARGDVAILTYDFRASGVVRNALRIGAALSASGLSVQFWVIRRTGQLTAEFEQSFEVQVLRNDNLSLPRDVDSLTSIPAIAHAINRLRPVVLLSAGNQMHVHAAIAMKLAKRRAEIRFIGRASNAVIDRGKRYSAAGLIAGVVERFQFRSMDRIIAVSRELQNDLINGAGVIAQKVTFVPNGIDLEKAQERSRECIASSGIVDGKTFILGVGRLSRQKDFATLICAFAIVRRDCRDLQLVIVGHGSDAILKSLHALAERLGVAGVTTFVGFHENPLAFMAKAAVFVSSSRWEGSSNVILEALACGTPIVATAAPTGVREVLEPDGLAPLTPVGDHVSMATAILKRLGMPQNGASLIQRAEQYPLARSMQAYVDCVTNEVMIARKGTPSAAQTCKEAHQ